MELSLRAQTTSAAPGGATQTAIIDYGNVLKEAELTYSRFDQPGKLVFSLIEGSGILLAEGSSIELVVDGVKMFKGYIFTIERNKEGETSYTAYDQLRYLKANASYIFENMTLAQIIGQIASGFGLTVGALEDTGYAFPCLIKEDESCLDMIFDALSQTIMQTGKIYVFYDNAGALTLTEAKNLYVNTLFGDASLVTDYTYKRDIDSDTYNRIKLVRKNEESGRTDAYVHEDTETQKRWGLLQYYEEVDEGLNESQIDEMCKNYLAYYNRVLQTVELEAVGVPQVRAGSLIPVRIGAVTDLSPTRILLAEKVTHSFEPDVHTMSIEIKSFEQLGGMQLV